MNPESRATTLAGWALETSAPGRICLFGEHQDYLGLPVIAAAIDLRVHVRAIPTAERILTVHLPDIGQERRLPLDEETAYEHARDYLPAAVNRLIREGVKWSCGYEVTVRSTIPINSGASSSSALQVAWCAFLLAAAGDPRAQVPAAIAKLAYESEVVEFRAPGGMMDHFTSALGGVIWLDPTPPYDFQPLTQEIGEFVLVDSGIPKDTNGVLGQTRSLLESLEFDFVAWKRGGFQPVENLLGRYEGVRRRLFQGTISNARLTVTARGLLSAPTVDPLRLGQLLDEHHRNLSQLIGVSHPQIDEYLEQGRRSGALGGKINGSGCGGSFFLLAPGRGEALRQLYRELGLRSWVVQPSSGVRIAPLSEKSCPEVTR